MPEEAFNRRDARKVASTFVKCQRPGVVATFNRRDARKVASTSMVPSGDQPTTLFQSPRREVCFCNFLMLQLDVHGDILFQSQEREENLCNLSEQVKLLH